MIKFLNNYFLTPLALFILLSSAVFSKPISLEEAKQIAMQHNLQLNKHSIELQDPSSYKLLASSHDIFSKATQNPTFYIYNFPQKGWAIVAGDDIVHPILAYSKEGSYSLENLPDVAKYWLEQYDLAISEAIKQGTPQAEKIADEWLIARNPKKRTSLLDEVVPPLIKTKWKQLAPYNDLCPYDNDAKRRAVVGCVAVTMAQIMKYWNFPEHGIGDKTYTHSKYGELYADFENTTYDWKNMTNEYNQNSTEEEIKAVATLMYHCGVALEMIYRVEASSAYSSYVATSLKTYFMYDDSVKIIYRSNYDDKTWTDILKENLDNSQPIGYSGYSVSGGGHSFVCDGYDTDGRFHFNLGWEDEYNAYYYLYYITKDYFDQRQTATINIKPSKGVKSQVSLLKPLELQQEIVYQNSTVKINANIVNKKSESFSGSISLRLFDAEDNFLMTIAEQEIDNLEVNKPTEIAFETNPLFNTSASKYYVKLYHKHNVLNHWLLSSGDNKLEINVQKPLSSESQLSLYSLPTLSAYQIDKEKENNLKATASFINTSETDFKGIISASIYNEKGTIIKELASYNVTEAISPNNHIKDIEFPNTISDLDYGIYFIGFRSKNEKGEFALVNTNNFISFIKFEIVPPDLITDLQLKKWIKSNTGQLPRVVVNEDGGITGTITNLEALSKIENLDCSNLVNIVSIDELIRTMSNLKMLLCSNSSLTELDVSKNIKLQELYCYTNQLTNLDISKNTKLSILSCSQNQLSNLDISKNIELIELYCYDNQLTNLDVSNNIGLTQLYCYQNQLTNLDISNNIGLTQLYCHQNQLANLDLSNNIELTWLYCHQNQLTNLDISENIKLTELACSQNQLNNLDISNKMKLTRLFCSENQLSSLDLSESIKLTLLACSQNQLNNLDISNNINLTELVCSQNQLNNLDISNNMKLTLLACSQNQLNNLDISNNINLTVLYCSENQLSSLELSESMKLTVLACSRNQLNNLDVSNNMNLTVLDCHQNQLNNLDVSKNMRLTHLDCSQNQLNNLDVSENIKLDSLYCSNNKITNLDIDKNIELILLDCSQNQLNNLNVNKNIELQELYCNDNMLDSLDISPLLDLAALNCCNQAEDFILYLTNEQKNIFTEEHYCNAILKEKDGSICEIEWLDIYPNPTIGNFFIDSKFFADEIKILNLAGEVLYRSTLNAEKTEIDISNLPAGVYLIKTKEKIGKVIKN